VSGAPARERLLAVVPFGMALRNIVLNETLWSALTARFDIDLVSPVGIGDPRALGIARVLRPPSPASLQRVLRAVNARLMDRLRLMDYADFFFRAHEAETFAVNCVTFGRRMTSRILFWSAVRMTSAGTAVERLLGSFARFHPVVPVTRRHYRAVLLGHNSEHECVTYARVANAAGVPVACIVMGVDNIAAEPLAFRPDLLLVWGEEMRRDFEEYQVPLNPALARTETVCVGSTIYDNYLAVPPDREAFCREIGCDPADEVILFPAHVESSLPNQTMIAETIVQFIVERALKATLLVRVRPGIDLEMWRAFQARFPAIVRLQDPAASSYDKSGAVGEFDPAREAREVASFARTIRNVAVTINPSFSTMALDSMAFGTPVMNAIYNAADPSALHRDLLWYLAVAEKTPVWRLMQVARSREQFIEMLERFFVARDRAPFCREEIVRYRATAVDGRCGARAARAIDAFLAPEVSQ
jgi:hypothetical protein